MTRAKQAAKTLAETLQNRVVAAIANGGQAAAVAVCSTEARELTAKIAAETGVRVGRSSLRLRNTANAGPEWVTAWLTTLGARRPDEIPPFTQITETSAGRVARFAKPIEVSGLCLGCHGPPEKIDAEVQAMLAERYPADQATGYQAGDLRGALWAEAPVR